VMEIVVEECLANKLTTWVSCPREYVKTREYSVPRWSMTSEKGGKGWASLDQQFW